MEFRIFNSTLQDIDAIFSLYDEAVVFQKLKFNKHWHSFNRTSVENEIIEGRHFKIVADESIAGIFSVTYNDAEIWGAKDADGAIYLHRIVTSNSFHGNNLVSHIIGWTKQFVLANHYYIYGWTALPITKTLCLIIQNAVLLFLVQFW